MFRAEQEPRPGTTGWQPAGFAPDHGIVINEFVDEFTVDLPSSMVTFPASSRAYWFRVQPGRVTVTRSTVSASTGTHDYPVNQPDWVTPEWEMDFDSWCDDSAVTFRGPDLETFMREDPWQQPFRWLLADPA